MPNRDASSVAAVTASTPLLSTGGTSPDLSLATLGTAGTIGGSGQIISAVTLDAYGRVSAATATSAPASGVLSVSGTAPIVSSGGSSPAISLATTGTAGTVGGLTGSGAADLTAVTLDAYGRISATSSTQIWYDLASLIGWDATLAAGNYTIGYVMIPWCAMSSTGASFYWPAVNPQRTITCTLWPGSGAALRTASIPVMAAGVYSVTWATPYSMTAKTLYRLSVWDSSLTSQLVSNLSDYGLPMSATRAGLIGPNLTVGSPVYGAGNSIPTTAKGSCVALTPMVTVP